MGQRAHNTDVKPNTYGYNCDEGDGWSLTITAKYRENEFYFTRETLKQLFHQLKDVFEEGS